MAFWDALFDNRRRVGQITKRPVLVLVVLIVALVIMGGNVSAQEATADLPANPDESVESAARWLVDVHQNSDGGFSSFSAGADMAPSDISGTADAITAIAAPGQDVSGPLDYLSQNTDQLIDFSGQDGSTAGKVVLALAAAGQNPEDFAGHDFLADIKDQRSADGNYGVESAFNQSLAILALAEAGETVPDNAISWLADLQEKEGELSGSWDDGFGTAGNSDATAMAVYAMLAAGVPESDETINRAIRFLDRTQLPSGNWEYGQGFGGNANSTATVIRALLALGYYLTPEWDAFSQDGNYPINALLAWQGESGAFQVDFGEGPADDFFATIQALPALATASDMISDSESGGFGGDSSLPFWLLGIALVVFSVLIVWYVRARRRGASVEQDAVS